MGEVPSGVPQGTKLGPWLFLIMISDLNISTDTFSTWKYVDDTTISEVIHRGEESEAQIAVDSVLAWSKENLFKLNTEKCKELRVSFSKTRDTSSYEDVNIENSPVSNTNKVKLLGITINNKLTWNDHIANVVKKAASRLYFLVQLKRSKVPTQDIVAYYRACVCSVMDYACPVFHYSLPNYLQNELERIQRRAMSIIFPNSSYQQALINADILTVHERQRRLSRDLFERIASDSNCAIHSLLPNRNNSSANTRNRRTFRIPVCKTNRFLDSFLTRGIIASLFV